MFTDHDYARLADLVFKADYPGYKPQVVEIPNGDGKRDDAKRYAHVALKYLTNRTDRQLLLPYLEVAHGVAQQAALAAGIPAAFMPDVRYGALRVLYYPPGAVSNAHQDFDLFTLMMYRDQPDRFMGHITDTRYGSDRAIRAIQAINRQAHLGQLGEVIGLGPATMHQVLPSDTEQHSVVYFAIPDHDAVLPAGLTVREWLNERMARSRTEFKDYE